MFNLSLSIVCFVIAGVMTFLGGYFLNQYHSEKSYKKSEVLSHQSRPRDIPKIRAFPAVVLSGTNAFILSPESRVRLSNISPYTIEAEKDGSILLRGDLRDSSGVVVASLTGTSLLVSPGRK
jgi:hypothetical protein